MRKLILLPFVFIALSPTVHADDTPNARTDAQTEVQRCGDGSQQQMNACMGEAYGKADAAALHFRLRIRPGIQGIVGMNSGR